MIVRPCRKAHERLVALGNGLTVIFETVVIVLTWLKTADCVRQLKKKNLCEQKTNLTSYLLLRDGESCCTST